MGNHQDNLLPETSLAVRHADEDGAGEPRRIPIAFQRGQAVFVRVRRRGDRRRDFLRRRCFRGVDELRRQQADSRPGGSHAGWVNVLR